VLARTKVERLRTVPGDIGRTYWSLYEEAFAPSKTLSPCRQYLTEEEFLAELADERIIKFVLWDGAEPLAMALIATDLAAVPWISPPYFERRFPEEFARGALWYFGALLSAPHVRRMGNAELLLDHIVNFVVSSEAVACFDCASFNAHLLPQLVKDATRKQANLDDADCLELDLQTYYAFTARGFRPGYGAGRMPRPSRRRSREV
jgi:hypothetical protein